jgi:heme-degrading monooxygenase HmoA
MEWNLHRHDPEQIRTTTTAKRELEADMKQKKVNGENAPGLLVVMNDIPAELEGEFNRWYHEEHLAERLSLPGFTWARRYRAVGGQPAYMVVYKCESIHVLHSPAYRHVLDNPTEKTRKIIPRLQNVIRAACRETWSSGNAIGGSAVIIQCKAIEGREEDARRFIKDVLAERLKESGGMVSMSLWESDAEVTAASNSETTRRSSPDHYADWVMLVESYDPALLSLSLHSEALQCDGQRDGLLIGSLIRYELMCMYKSP